MKKFLSTFIVGVSLIVVMSISVLATPLFQTSTNTNNLPGKDKWTRGVKAGTGNNGYYMSYSYYYNPTYNHMSGAYIGGQLLVSDIKGPYQTSCVNSKSYPSYSDARVSAAAQQYGSWRYVKDYGYGDQKASGF